MRPARKLLLNALALLAIVGAYGLFVLLSFVFYGVNWILIVLIGYIALCALGAAFAAGPTTLLRESWESVRPKPFRR